MRTKVQHHAENTGKIVLLTGVIVLALAILAFLYFRSNASSGESSSGSVKQMLPGVRSRHVTSPTGGE